MAEESVGGLRRLSLYVGALVALVGGSILLLGYAQTGAWWLVRGAHDASLSAAFAQAAVEERKLPPRAGAALQTDVDQLAAALTENRVILVKLTVSLEATSLLAGASACQQAGGTPHKPTAHCVFVVPGGGIELVSLTDADALLARYKLAPSTARKVKAALKGVP